MTRARFITPFLLMLIMALPQAAQAKEKKNNDPPVPIIPAQLSSEAEPTEINGVYWGMTEDQVRARMDQKPKAIEQVDTTWLDKVAGKPCVVNYIYDQSTGALGGIEAFYDREQPLFALLALRQGERFLNDFNSMSAVLTGQYGPADGPLYLRENFTPAPPPDNMAEDIMQGFTILRSTWALPNTIVCMELYPTSLITHQLKSNIWTGVNKERKVTKELGIRITFASREFYPVIIGVRDMELDDVKKNKAIWYPEVGRGEPKLEGKQIN